MARPLRIEFPGAVYHVTSRGNAKNSIFFTDGDQSTFLSILEEIVERYRWFCYAYCLMPNHYHLLVETQEGNLSRGMRQLNGVYTQTINKRHEQCGHLFQGRYKAILVQKENYLLQLCRYIVLNPVKARLVSDPEKWKWSSYAGTAGIKQTPKFLQAGWVLSQFGNDKAAALAEYKNFVAAGKSEESIWGQLHGKVFLGTEQFADTIEVFLKDKEKIKELSKVERFVVRPKLGDIFGDETKKETRDKNIYLAHVRHGYELQKIANFLNLHYSGVSRICRRQREKDKESVIFKT